MPARSGEPNLVVGDTVTVEVHGREVQARVQALLPLRERRTRAVEARLSLPAETGAVQGDLVALTNRRSVPAAGTWLPLDALTEAHRGLWACFVVVPDRKGVTGWRLERRELAVLHHDRGRAFVQGTLTDGERVVQAGAHKLVPGLPVQLARSSEDQR